MYGNSKYTYIKRAFKMNIRYNNGLLFIGLLVNYTYDNLKYHSNANKSGISVEFNFKIKFD